ncbi:hypothetical protein K1T44_2874 [Listeria innocua]|nr:hypothetical protein K1T44_2874 [Listeria innocua]SPX82871.1 Uncharacterised protein [Listeria innocua]
MKMKKDIITKSIVISIITALVFNIRRKKVK